MAKFPRNRHISDVINISCKVVLYRDAQSSSDHFNFKSILRPKIPLEKCILNGPGVSSKKSPQQVLLQPITD